MNERTVVKKYSSVTEVHIRPWYTYLCALLPHKSSHYWTTNPQWPRASAPIASVFSSSLSMHEVLAPYCWKYFCLFIPSLPLCTSSASRVLSSVSASYFNSVPNRIGLLLMTVKWGNPPCFEVRGLHPIIDASITNTPFDGGIHWFLHWLKSSSPPIIIHQESHSSLCCNDEFM